MTRSVLRSIALSVLALVVVAAAGWTGYREARAQALVRADEIVRIDGVVHVCGPHRGVYVAVSGPVGARFVVDGVEVPGERREAYGTSPVSSAALLPDALGAPDCTGGVAHRYEILAAAPGGCSWSVRSQQTQEEARGHQQALLVSGTGCVLTLG